MYTYIYIYIYVCNIFCVYTYIYIHIYIYMYVHAVRAEMRPTPCFKRHLTRSGRYQIAAYCPKTGSSWSSHWFQTERTH